MKRWDGLVDGYLQRGETLGLSAATLTKRRYELDRWGCWLKRRRPRVNLEEVEGARCIEYIRSRTRFHAKATVAGVSSEMRCLGEYLVEAGLWRKNPMRWVQGPRLDPRGRLPRRIGAEHLKKIWEATRLRRSQYQLHVAVVVLALLYGTGLRRGELERLDVEDWKGTERLLMVDGRKTGRERSVPVLEGIGRWVEGYLPLRQNLLEQRGKLGEVALLINRNGERMSADMVGVLVHRLARQAGVPLVSLHQFRYTCASDLLESGVSLPEVQRLLGHASVQTTSRYLQIADPERARAMKKPPLNDYLGQSEAKGGHHNHSRRSLRKPGRGRDHHGKEGGMKSANLDPWIEGYPDYQRTVRRLAPKSIVDMRCTLKRVVAGMAKIRPGQELWKVTLQDYLAWLNRQREEGYSAQSLSKDLSHVRGLLDYAWRSGRADRNVLDGFSLKDSFRVVAPKALSLEQARSLVEACPGRTRLQRRDRLVILLLYGCGLRTSELCQLDVGDVDVERQEIVVRHGKGDRARRIPVPDGVWTMLLAYLTERKGRRGALIRTEQKQARFAAKDVCAVVRRAVQGAGLEVAVTPKSLRHSLATHLMDRGVDVAVIASLMGHRSAQETGVYLHGLPGRREEAVKLLLKAEGTKI